MNLDDSTQPEGLERTRARSLLRLQRRRQKIYRLIEQDEILPLKAEHHADAERRISQAIEQLEEIALDFARLDSGLAAHD